jgi:hypothetical protein
LGGLLGGGFERGSSNCGGVVDEGKLLGHHRQQTKRNIKISPFFMKESANGSYGSDGSFPFSVESFKSNVVIFSYYGK